MPQHPSGEPTPFGGPAGLLGGWSYLNDPEPCSLPSTVDMAAFKAGPSDTINAPCTEATPSGSSDSEGSNSSSSDSDSSSSSGGGPRPRAATAPGPRFSVTSSDSVGLRLKIAAIPNRTISKPKETEKKNNKSKQQPEKQEAEKIKEPSSSDTSCDSGSCSGCSDSESASENVRTSQGSARTRSARLKRPTKKK